MNVLWDMRLFSTGYRDRGVGMYCRETALSVLRQRPELSIYVWANPEHLPAPFASNRIHIIPYCGGSWKSSICMLPWLAVRHRINLIHYWVALGPLSSIGIAPILPVPAVATIHDLGVELWNTPHGNFIRNTPYWRAQRRFFSSVHAVTANSSSTLCDTLKYLHVTTGIRDVVYMSIPPCAAPPPSRRRSPYFVALGGGTHKNLARTVEAFAAMQRLHPDYRLILLGHIDPAEKIPDPLPEGISREPSMERYEEHLQACSGLLFCSLYEGLGIPPLEAMRCGCPLLLSDIAPLRETCDTAGLFVDPESVESISGGIAALIADSDAWARKSAKGMHHYQSLCSRAPEQICSIYEQVTGKPFNHSLPE